MDFKVYLGLGSNQGDREKHLKRAIKALGQHDRIQVIKCSDIYQTTPVGYLCQDDFLNMVALIQTSLCPRELLKIIKNIEKSLGRKQSLRWGPRTIDIDILLFGDIIVNQDDLIIPHKEMLNRGFVLIPLKQIYDNENIGGINIDLLIQKANDSSGVKFYKKFRL